MSSKSSFCQWQNVSINLGEDKENVGVSTRYRMNLDLISTDMNLQKEILQILHSKKRDEHFKLK